MTDTSLDGVTIAAIMTTPPTHIDFPQVSRIVKATGAEVHVVTPPTMQSHALIDSSAETCTGTRCSERFVAPTDYDAIWLPGDMNDSLRLRTNAGVLDFVAQANEDDMPIATMCHGCWVLISAGIVRGRKVTACHTVKDDLVNAGAFWMDMPVIVDENLITARHPENAAPMVEQLLEVLQQLNARGHEIGRGAR